MDAVINKTFVFQFDVDREKKIPLIGNSDVKHGGLSWWRHAFIRNNKLSLGLELTVLDSFTGPLPNKILIKLELLNKRNHEFNKMKKSTINLINPFYWDDIISMEELGNHSLGFVDDQGVFTFQLVVLHVTNK
ncbi:hypothetical protein SNE40_006790 [Patella caerulea]|uniref:MATH domain-containing protein n=1 Tax=Patella caerulea TaxID=87958 RepID=A0AAN8Q6S8_PATCE